MGNVSNKEFNKCENLNLENITNPNKIVNCVDSLTGLKADSASASDVYILNFNPNSLYNGLPLKKGFQKLFITKISKMVFTNDIADKEIYIDLPDEIPMRSITYVRPGFPDTFIPFEKIDFTSSHILLYEYYIYKLKIAPLIYYNISPHFIKFLGGVTETDFKNMTEFLNDKISGSNLKQIENNFRRNVIFLFSDYIINRPEITNNTKLVLEKYTKNQFDLLNKSLYQNPVYKAENYKYGFILNEAVNIPDDISNRNIGQSITYGRFLNELEIDKDTRLKILNVIFQIAQGCYAMELSGINHNDLHSGNIYLKLTKENISTYYINDKVYQIKCENLPMIYDFDRAYVDGFQNSFLDKNDWLKGSNQINRIRPSFDIVKSCVYVLVTLKRKLKELYYNLKYKSLPPDEFSKTEDKIKIGMEIIDDIFYILLKDINKKGNWETRLYSYFLVGDPTLGIKDEIAYNEFKLISSYENILEKIYEKILSVRPEKTFENTDHTYVMDEKIFRNYYVDHEKYEKVLGEIIKDNSKVVCKDKLTDLQNKLDNLQEQYDDLLIQKKKLESRLGLNIEAREFKP